MGKIFKVIGRHYQEEMVLHVMDLIESLIKAKVNVKIV